jgi:hypothetical protein
MDCSTLFVPNAGTYHPTKKAVSGFHHCLRYLKFSLSSGLMLGAVVLQVAAWPEADWGGSMDGQSFSGNLVQLLGSVTWRCSKQLVTGLLTTEVEHQSCSESGQDILWLSSLLEEIATPIGLTIILIPMLQNDNKVAIFWLENTMYYHATCQINIWLNWIQYHVDKSFTLKFCSYENLADSLTKSLPKAGIAASKLAAGVGEIKNMGGCDDNKVMGENDR